MKKILFGLLVLATSATFAQNDRDDNNRTRRDRDDRKREAPENVRRNFQQQYPNVQNAQWNNVNGQWHGTYRDENNRNVETYYTADGRRVDTHYAYGQNDLPAAVRDRANTRYKTYNSYRIDRANGQPVYQVRTRDGKTIYMDENGNRTTYRDRH